MSGFRGEKSRRERERQKSTAQGVVRCLFIIFFSFSGRPFHRRTSRTPCTVGYRCRKEGGGSVKVSVFLLFYLHPM